MALVASFAGVFAKRRRADAHLQVINDKLAGFFAANPYRFVGEYDAAAGQLVVKAQKQVFPDVDLWSTIIGDCVHNLRAALDHLAHQLVKLQGGTPRMGRSGTAFPIYDSNVGPKGGSRTVHISGENGFSIAGPVLELVKMVQPYERVGDVNGHPLWILSELDNMDKHRELALTNVAMEDFGLGIGAMQDVSMHFEFVGFHGPFDEHTELARFAATASGPNPHVEMNGYGTIQVAFDANCGPAAGRLVSPTLDELRYYVRNITAVIQAKALEEAGF